MLRKCIIVTGLLTLGYILIAWVPMMQERSEESNLIKVLRSEKREGRELAKKVILDNRKKLIEDLINIVKLESEDKLQWIDYSSAKNIAMETLGEMRAIEAIDVLIPNIAPRQGQVVNYSMSTPYIAAESLGKIGAPAVPKLLEKLATTDEETVIWASSGTLYSIYGYDVGKFVLEKEIDAQTDETKKARLKKALEEFEKIEKKAKETEKK